MSAPAYEKSDVTIKGVVMFTSILAVSTAVIMVLMAWMFWGYQGRMARADASRRPATLLQEKLPEHPPVPILQGSPGSNVPLGDPIVEMEDWDAHMDETLAGSGWVDRNEDVVRIPIEDAKRLVLERGLPVREGGR